MNSRSRITSILDAKSLDSSVTGLQSFSLSELIIDSELDFELPSNLRLGHLAEAVVSGLIKLSTNYKVLYENVQIIDGKQTIGEVDFILEEVDSNQLLHLELAYKFYLYDPDISSVVLNNWIGPNRNDSLSQKLEKVKEKQFPLLNHDSAQSMFDQIEMEKVSQVLCLLVSLYLPYDYKGSFRPAYANAIKGYYLSSEKLYSFDHTAKWYYLPSKLEWGIDPSQNNTWFRYNEIKQKLNESIQQKQAPLCWMKNRDTFESFFITWW